MSNTFHDLVGTEGCKVSVPVVQGGGSAGKRALPEQQYGLFPADKTIDQRFEEWKTLPGAGKVLEMFYREGAFYYRRFRETGVRCAVALIEEKVRDSIRLENLKAVPERGFALNCHFCSRIVRHMIAEHPEWRAMFELREVRA